MAEEVKSEDASLSAEDAPVSIEEQPSTSAQEPAAPSLLLDSTLFQSLRLDWEVLAWAAILIVAVVTRFYALGERVMSHDESLHAVYSLELYRSGSYQHNPMMHGPFLFHANALIYFLFGVSDATTRVMPALAGIGSIVMAWFYRRWIGRLGAFMAGLLMLVSPSLLFHSRYIRNDIYIVFFAMIWVYGMFRFVEERKMKWLYLTVGAMALGFVTKENQFMTGTIFGVFLVGAALWRWLTGRERILRGPFADLAVLFLTLVLPFTAPFGHRLLGWDALAHSTAEDLAKSALFVLLMSAFSVMIAMFWFVVLKNGSRGNGISHTDGPEQSITFTNWATLMGMFWAIQIVFFTTFFTNSADGLATGVVGSLGYWLDQQEVQRGSQPWYYYLLQGLLYEILPIFLSLGGITLLLWRGVKNIRRSRAQEEEETLAEEEPESLNAEAAAEDYQPALSARPYVILLLAWWTIAAWLAYSYAGEKMPWLMSHLAQPMALLGAWWCARQVKRIDWKEVRATHGWWVLALLPALLFMLAALFVSFPLGGREVDALARTVRFIPVIGAILVLLFLVGLAFVRYGWQQILRMAAVVAAALLFLLTIRFSYLLTFLNYDMATEYLVYAHAAPDVKVALEEIDKISERTVGEREIQVAYDDDVAWPMTWYMRFYPNAIFYGANPSSESMTSPIILVGNKNYAVVEPYVARDYVSRNYRLIWWPEESYKGVWDGDSQKHRGLTFAQMWGALTDAERRNRLWQIFFYRNHPDRSLTAWPHVEDFRMYVRKDIANLVWDLNVAPAAAESPRFDYTEIERSATGVYSGPYADLPLIAPRALTVGPDARRYILDTGNNRVIVLSPDGSFELTFGSSCFLDDVVNSGCVDLDGGGPLEMGDGQFREPWGVAVAADGTIFVADTWNGRIQAFDRAGNFLHKWGVFGTVSGENGDPFVLFGPRGLTMLPSGNLLVADTGNKRLIEFTPGGEYVRQVGGGGIILGHFDEPVDVTVHPPTGLILVSDAWNRRIQVLTADLQPLTEWPMPTWESDQIWDKPYLAAGADGMIYASDPQYAQVLIISADGVVRASFGRYGSELNRFAKPTGIAIDPLTGEILIADAENNRILVFGNE